MGPGLELRSVSKALQFPDLKPQTTLFPSLQLILTQEVERHWPGGWEIQLQQALLPSAGWQVPPSPGLCLKGGLERTHFRRDLLWMGAVCRAGLDHACVFCTPHAWGGPWLREGHGELSLTVGLGGSMCGRSVGGHRSLQVSGKGFQDYSSRVRASLLVLGRSAPCPGPRQPSLWEPPSASLGDSYPGMLLNRETCSC